MRRKIQKGERRYISKQRDSWTHQPVYMASVNPDANGRKYGIKGLMTVIHQGLFIPCFDCEGGEEARQDVDVALRNKFNTSIEDYVFVEQKEAELEVTQA